MDKRGDRSLLGETLGNYFVKNQLGQGGMGAVYLATDVALDRQVALKVLLARHAQDHEFIARFQREARASAKLNHPNIVQIYTVTVDADPPYMAMEYIEGQNLEAYIRQRQKLSWQQALGYVGQVASALACAHGAGIIHRDIKPANVLIDRGGRARVTDFGIAKVMGSNTDLTGTQHTVGSPCYMSPEQCGAGDVVPASDLFSLGIMLYEMLTGTVPFKADSSIAVMRMIVDKDLPRLYESVAHIPPAVQTILDGLTARALPLRYSNAEQVLADLTALQSGNTMRHAESLHLQRAAQGPASPSAADLTRSPTGTGVSLDDSLVQLLLDVKKAPVVRARRQWLPDDLPWTGIFVTVSVIFLGVLAMLYVKGMESSRPLQPAYTERPADNGERRPEDGPPPRRENDPNDGIPPEGGGTGHFRPPPPPGQANPNRPPPPQGRLHPQPRPNAPRPQ